MKTYGIKDVFFVKDRELIIIHLKDFDWDFKSYGIVYLCCHEQRVKMDYTGFGNHEGNPALSLKLNDSRFDSIREIESEIKGCKEGLFLER